MGRPQTYVGTVLGPHPKPKRYKKNKVKKLQFTDSSLHKVLCENKDNFAARKVTASQIEKGQSQNSFGDIRKERMRNKLKKQTESSYDNEKAVSTCTPVRR